MLRRAGRAIPGVRWLKRQLFRLSPLPISKFQVSYPVDRGPSPTVDRDHLRTLYRNGPLSSQVETFVLYRIIGNDLPPRHSTGQSPRNLAFILEHEHELPGCEKRFVVNRIVDPNEEQAVLRLLEDSAIPYLHIPFDEAEYRKAHWDIEGVPVHYSPWTTGYSSLSAAEQGRVLMRLYRYKNNYVMNNNGARNAALREGRELAKWVLPWDGNCFVSESAWEQIINTVRLAPELRYFVVPMARISNNALLLDPEFQPRADGEPQILFRCDAINDFDEAYYYGRRPKIELLWRLGVPGDWDWWPLEPWDLPCPVHGEDAGEFGHVGWVARLSSGQVHLEGEQDSAAFDDRGFARDESVKLFLDSLDDRGTSDEVASDTTIFISSSLVSAAEPLKERMATALHEIAQQALTRGPFSVVHKTSLPPSGNRHDYWSPAPYSWPHPWRVPGLPSVRRDGQRVPGSLLYEPASENYDRTRLQRLFDDTFVLTLAWRAEGHRAYAEHAARLVRTWFLEPETVMNPHLEYAQVRRGHNRNKGSSSGVIEWKDLYFFLDAIKLLVSAGWLSGAENSGLEDWFERYLRWLQSSEQGRQERAALNNHGTCYDLQVTAIAAFLGEIRLARETLRDSRSRMLVQFDTIGMQPEEMKRTNTAHYCCFGLQAWIHLAQLAEGFGEDLWSFQSADGRGLMRAMRWLLSHAKQDWPYPQLVEFDPMRFFPIGHVYKMCYSESGCPDLEWLPSSDLIKPVFHPHDGIMPFWQLGLRK